MPTELGSRLKTFRQKNNLTQKDVAKALNVGRATIAGYETKSIYPDYDKLKVLAELFNCTADYLLGISNIPERFNDSELRLLSRTIDLIKAERIIDNDGKIGSSIELV